MEDELAAGISWSRPSSRSRRRSGSGSSKPRTSSARRTVIALGYGGREHQRCTLRRLRSEHLLGEVAIEGFGGPLLGKCEVCGEGGKPDHCRPALGLTNKRTYRIGRASLEHTRRLFVQSSLAGRGRSRTPPRRVKRRAVAQPGRRRVVTRTRMGTSVSSQSRNSSTGASTRPGGGSRRGRRSRSAGHASRSSARSSASGRARRSVASPTRSRWRIRSPAPGTTGCYRSASPAENAPTSAEAGVARIPDGVFRGPAATLGRASVFPYPAGAVSMIDCASPRRAAR